MKLSISPVAEFAEAKNIEISSPPSISSSEELKKLQEMNLDMIIVVAYGMILPEEVINLLNLVVLMYMHLYFLGGGVLHQFKEQ